MIHRFKLFIFSLIAFFTSVSVFAALTPAELGTRGDVSPGRVEKRLQQPLIQSKAQPQSEIKSLSLDKQAPFPDADKIDFKLTKVILVGNTMFSASELRSTYRSQLGKKITLADLQGIAEKITAKYRDAGYILSQAIIPPQNIKGGVVKLRVIEGFIQHASVKGKVYAATTRTLLEIYANKAAQGRPLQIKTLERYALLANDLPGITVRTVITPSAKTMGAADLVFVVEHKGVSAQAIANNFGTRLLGPRQIDATVFVDSMFYGNRVGFRAVRSGDFRELKYYQVLMQQPVGENGLLLNVNLDRTETLPNFADIGILGVPQLAGKSESVFFALTYPVIRSRKRNFTLEAILDVLNTNTNVVIARLFDDRIRSLRLGMYYDFADKYKGINLISARLSQGLNILGERRTGSPNLSRSMGKSDYTKIEGHISRLQRLTRYFSLLLAADGQYAFNQLLASEEYGFGGVQFGRGYDPSEILGDSGLAGKVELRLDILSKFFAFKQLQFFIFYDGGIVWNRNATGLPSAPLAKQTATSAGGGLRFAFAEHVSGQVFIAKPIDLVVANEGNKDARAFFEVILEL